MALRLYKNTPEVLACSDHRSTVTRFWHLLTIKKEKKAFLNVTPSNRYASFTTLHTGVTKTTKEMEMHENKTKKLSMYFTSYY